jgi:hypothetical protein
MKTAVNPPSPWQPFTPGGVAALATAAPGRLFRAQAIVATFTAGSLTWFLATTWFPVIDAAAAQLPGTATIRARTLEWTGPVPIRLAGNGFLSVTVDPDGTASPQSTTDVEIELGRHELRARSLLGYVAWDYPEGYRIGLSRTEFMAWWGAWRTPALAIIGSAAFIGQFLYWAVLAILYAAPIRFIAFYADRGASSLTCLRAAAAALLPSSVVMGAVIVLYGLGRIDLVGLLFGLGLHFVVGWGYVLLTPFSLRRVPNVPKRRANPFRR